MRPSSPPPLPTRSSSKLTIRKNANMGIASFDLLVPGLAVRPPHTHTHDAEPAAGMEAGNSSSSAEQVGVHGRQAGRKAGVGVAWCKGGRRAGRQGGGRGMVYALLTC